MSSGTRRAEIETLEAKLAASNGQVERLLADNAELTRMLAEVHRELDAAQADVARLRALHEKSIPNCPERVASAEQQAALDAVLESLAFKAVVDNDPDPADDADKPTATADPPPVALPPTTDPDARPAKTPPARRSGGGRRRLDLTSLPVKTIVIDPPEVTLAGGVGYVLVGEEASERICYAPAHYVRLRIVRRTYRRVTGLDTHAAAGDATPRVELARDVDASQPSVEFVTAPIPDAVWPGLLADPSAIAHVIVSKYDDLLPLHRQEGISRREGFTVSRSTQCGWFGPAHAVLGRIVDAMFDDGKANAFCMATDATSARVRESLAPCTPWHVFVFVADQDHVVFRHSRTHDSVVLAQMLKGYQGYLLGDATSIYSPLVTAEKIILACCWAHVRRYFFKARESDPARAVEAISIIGKLFDIERACSDLKGDLKTSRRARLAAPVLALFDEWLDKHRPSVDPRSPMQRAITYADNQAVELRRFLADGRLRLDNNVCEGLLRNLVLGLNNWQRFESESGLQWYTTFRSLIASCKLHGLCPQRYLECVLRLAPHWSQLRMLELSPKYWRATAAALTAEQRAIVAPEWTTAFDAFDPALAAPTTHSSDATTTASTVAA